MTMFFKLPRGKVGLGLTYVRTCATVKVSVIRLCLFKFEFDVNIVIAFTV